MAKPYSILSDPVLPRLMSHTETTLEPTASNAFATTDALYAISSTDDLKKDKFELFQRPVDHSEGHKKRSLCDLPNEILHLIIVFIYSNNITVAFGKHLEWFAKNVLLINKKFYILGLKLFVNYCRFTCPQTFDIFNKYWSDKRIHLQSSDTCHSIYKYINVLDFQEFTSVGLGRTKRMNNEIQMVTKNTIYNFLVKAENLKEFLSSENIQNDISTEILIQLFFKHKSLRSMDFCGSTGESFSGAFKQLLNSQDQTLVNYFILPITNLTNISFHDCIDIPQAFFPKFLKLLPNLEKLDLYHTKITGEGVMAIHENCQLTHLSIGCCYQLEKRHILQFFITHPSTKTRLKWVNIETDNVNDMTERELLIILKSFTFNNVSDDGSIDAPSNSLIPNYHLQYLNLNGRKTTAAVLDYIKKNFIFLKSLHIQNTPVSLEELILFLSPPTKVVDPEASGASMHHLTDYFNSQRASVASLDDYLSFQRGNGPSSSASSIRSSSSNQALTMTVGHNNHTTESITSETSHLTTRNPQHDISDIYQQLRFINVKGARKICNNWTLSDPTLIECCPSLLAWEFDLSILENSPTENYHYNYLGNHNAFSSYTWNMDANNIKEEYFWKVFQTNGRRSWLYKLRSYNEKNSKYLNYNFNFDKDYHPKKKETKEGDVEEEEDLDYEVLTDDPYFTPNATQYDLETGKKIEPKLVFYPFLKYASRKIDMSDGPFYTGANELYKIWPVKFSERGIYKYYALSV